MKEFKLFLIGFAVFAFLIFFFALLINAVPASWMRGCEVFLHGHNLGHCLLCCGFFLV